MNQEENAARTAIRDGADEDSNTLLQYHNDAESSTPRGACARCEADQSGQAKVLRPSFHFVDTEPSASPREPADLPSPLVPADIDLRDWSFMPLDVVRLRDSDFAVTSNGEAFRAAVMLWCAAWHQVPASSLPNDDRLLANLAGYGRDVGAWRDVRTGALHGFVLCTDGRLYHPVIAEKAIEANGKRRAGRARTAKATEAARMRRLEEDGKDEDRDGVRNGLRDGDRNDQEEKGIEEKGIETPSLRSGESGATRTDPPPAVSSKPKTTRATRLLADWKPSDDDFAAAEAEGFGRLDAERIANKFRDYWHAKSGANAAKLDWPATWRNWVRRDAENRKPYHGPGPNNERPQRRSALEGFDTLDRAAEAGLNFPPIRGV